MKLRLSHLESPVGRILIVSRDDRICALDFADYRTRMMRLLTLRFGDAVRLEPGPAPPAAAESLDAYFAGGKPDFASLSLDTAGTPFQQQVWGCLKTIPYGTTLSYGELGRRIGRPGAARAVGHANALNPIAIVVPCHRVVGGHGDLQGYAGGIERKRWLLAHERQAAAAVTPDLPIHDRVALI